MVNCPSCSTDNSETSKFCSQCGIALQPDHAVTVTHGGKTGPSDDSTLLIAAGILAFYNIRTGRGDRRGSARVAIYMLCATSLGALMVAHRLSLTKAIFPLVAQSLYFAAMVWLIYVALEPLVRRIWPRMLISWTRVVDGRLDDPLVGQALLVGALAGVAIQLNAVIVFFIMHALDPGSNLSNPPAVLALSGSKEVLGLISLAPIGGVFNAALSLFLLLVLRMILRREIAAVFSCGLLLTVLGMLVFRMPPDMLSAWYVFAVAATVHIGILVRFGFLAAVVTHTTGQLIVQSPLTLDSDQWYYEHGLFLVTFVFLLAAYGCYTSLGGRSFVRGLGK